MEDQADNRDSDGQEAFELEEERPEDLEAAMRDALEAVEKRVEESPGEAGIEAVSGDDQVDVLQAELEDLRDRSMRTLADFDNYRKRVERERADERRYAGLEVLREVLPILDNLERALRSEGPVEDLKAGVEMVARQMRDSLKAFGVERVAAEDQPFDPRLHEAVAREEQEDLESPVVVEELLAGYTLYDRLLRPATVKVAVPVDAEDATSLTRGPALAPDAGETP